MAKSRISKKVKQVAKLGQKDHDRLKKSPKFKQVDVEELTLESVFADVPVGTMIKDGKLVTVPFGTAVAADGNTATTGDGYEFAIGEKPEDVKATAIQRDQKVALKIELKRLVAIFRNSIELRLDNLSKQIIVQLDPLVKTVADIAVAKVELENRVRDFEDSLSATLNLNDELEPMDITLMFEPDTGLDDEMSTYTSLPNVTAEDEMELLSEVTGIVTVKHPGVN